MIAPSEASAAWCWWLASPRVAREALRFGFTSSWPGETTKNLNDIAEGLKGAKDDPEKAQQALNAMDPDSLGAGSHRL